MTANGGADPTAMFAALGERMSRIEVGLNQGGTYVEAIMTRVGTLLDSIGERIQATESGVKEEITRVDTETKRTQKGLQEVFDSLKGDMKNLMNEAISREAEHRQVMQTTIEELQTWTSKADGQMSQLGDRTKGIEAWMGGVEGTTARVKSLEVKMDDLEANGN